ncbi:hypothetical protein ALI22I_46485 [Saccharothrix sp. ALI-22-I]|uniref:hypothetical protein n=1 Tax=Saccharothrix sp. ALI-22-I TaxID=1933778 RepID=UPI00097BFF4B|nr:hypothetical protein [Saccharothrix sp. ALI-22-I]ONI80702.1 hypothetical protein ALI22I_46485 [Saccharothrix sp. ALI-22-I]
MDKTRVGCWSVVALIVAQTFSTVLSGGPPELRIIGVFFNAAAAFSVYLVLRRPDRNRWPLVAWTAGFFGWHVTGLLTLAGIVTTGLDAAFIVGVDNQFSVFYQAVLTTLAGFAVHLLLPRPNKT